MKAHRLPVDHVVPVNDFLAGQVHADLPDSSVALSLPPKWVPAHSAAVVVESDGAGMDEWPVYTSDQIRVTVYAASRTQARTLAARCLGWLLSLRVPGIGVRPGTAILDDRDPHTGGFTAGFTVRTRARTTTF